MRGRVSGIKAFLGGCVGAALAAGLCGCAMIGEQYVLERQFTESQVRTIRNGETTKREILDRFGPPAAVARPESGAADNVLRRFTETGGDGTGQLIYRYKNSALTWADLCIFGPYGGGCWSAGTPVLTTQDLWILIDDKAGRVVEHVLEETEREDNGAGVKPWLGPP